MTYGFKKIPSPVLKEKEGEVMYPVSYQYNGGIVYQGCFYRGFKVGKPKVPKGFKLVSMGVGLQLNATPPLATARLIRTINRKGEVK